VEEAKRGKMKVKEKKAVINKNPFTSINLRRNNRQF